MGSVLIGPFPSFLMQLQLEGFDIQSSESFYIYDCLNQDYNEIYQGVNYFHIPFFYQQIKVFSLLTHLVRFLCNQTSFLDVSTEATVIR